MLDTFKTYGGSLFNFHVSSQHFIKGGFLSIWTEMGRKISKDIVLVEKAHYETIAVKITEFWHLSCLAKCVATMD